jgi:predicted permease
MHDLLQDVRYAFRQIARAPGMSAVMVATLALGIGATTTIFIAANAVLFRPFPYEEPDRILAVRTALGNGWDRGPFSYPDFHDVREKTASFSAMAAYRSASFNLAVPGQEPERVEGEQVSASVFGLLGVRPAQGRDFRADDDVPGAEPVVLLSDLIWKRRFAADPGIVDQTILLNGQRCTVIGIMPPDFLYPADQQLWVPLRLSPTVNRGAHSFEVIGRLRDGVGEAEAQVELDALMRALEQQYSETNTGKRANLASLHEQEMDDTITVVWILLGAVGFVLLIACANVANLLLARAAGRQREIAIRTAIGASRGRIVRQLLTESVILAGLGAVAGLLIAVWGNDFIVRAVPADKPFWMQFTFDWRVFTFVALVAVGSGLLFGLAPALHASSPDLNESLKEGGQGAGTGRGKHRLRAALVVTEVALSLILLVGAGLMVRSFLTLRSADPGLDRGNTLTMSFSMLGPTYDSVWARRALLDRLQPQLAAIPGVRIAALINILPLTGSNSVTIVNVEGVESRIGEEQEMNFKSEYGDATRVLGIALKAGRTLTVQDITDSARVIVINETAARRLWPGQDALGKRLRFGRDAEDPWYEVVGIVADVRDRDPSEPIPNQAYLPYRDWEFRNMSIVLRTDGPPLALAQAARTAVQALDPMLPVYNVQTMERIFTDSYWDRKLYSQLFGAFAVVALLLATVGLYAVIAYGVEQRTQEIGVRMALGAGLSDVVTMVARHGAVLTGIGLGLGLAGALALTRVLRGLMFGVSVTDPLVFAGVALVLAASALVACVVPARRAARVHPVEALRYE